MMDNKLAFDENVGPDSVIAVVVVAVVAGVVAGVRVTGLRHG